MFTSPFKARFTTVRHEELQVYVSAEEMSPDSPLCGSSLARSRDVPHKCLTTYTGLRDAPSGHRRKCRGRPSLSETDGRTYLVQARRRILISDDDQERVVLSVDGLAEMLRFNFRVAPFPQDALKEVRTTLLQDGAGSQSLPVPSAPRQAHPVRSTVPAGGGGSQSCFQGSFHVSTTWLLGTATS